MIDIASFSTSVHKVAKKFKYCDDIESELWLKVMEVMPKLQEVKYEELEPLLYTILKNHAIDLNRAHKRSIEGTYSPLEDVLESAAGDFVEETLESTQFNQEQLYQYHELKKHIITWSFSQTCRIQRMWREKLDPSDECIRYWNNLQQTNKMYKQFDSIPLATIGKMLGIPPVVINKSKKRLQTYLHKVGYLN